MKRSFPQYWRDSVSPPSLPCLTCKPKHTISGERRGGVVKVLAVGTGESRRGSWLSEGNLRWALRPRRWRRAETERLSAAARRADKSQQNVPSRLDTNETLCAWQPDGCLDVVFICRPSLGGRLEPGATHPGASWYFYPGIFNAMQLVDCVKPSPLSDERDTSVCCGRKAGGRISLALVKSSFPRKPNLHLCRVIFLWILLVPINRTSK